jgi:AraC family transcriptional regulator
MEIPYLQQNLIVSRVQECIGTRLNRELSLSTSTEESGYSREYFLLIVSCGDRNKSHQYVLERRIACAKQLLKERRTDLVEVAIASDVSSQTHMTDSFRNHLGISPG